MLSSSLLLEIWESGQRLHPLDRGLLILDRAYPQMGRDGWAALPVGRRDGVLLDLYIATFGAQFIGTIPCPHCAEALEFDLYLPTLKVESDRLSDGDSHRFAIGAYEFHFRPANTFDQVALLAGEARVDTARQILRQRCLLNVTYQGEPIVLADVPPAVYDQFAEAMTDVDPQAVLMMALSCPACQAGCSALFDIVHIFWSKLSFSARRLIQDIHLLASAYGWSEADILNLSAKRRQAYLNAVVSP